MTARRVPEGDRNHVHVQGVPEAVWTVTHNLGKYASVGVMTSAGDFVDGDVRHIDLNTTVITFGAAFSGKAVFN